eukprot:2103425-Pyramimonas_sp.AAC.1
MLSGLGARRMRTEESWSRLHSGSKHRAHPKAHATRAQRWRKLTTKKKKLATMKFTKKGHKSRLAITSIVPTVLYGGAVHAFSPSQVLRLRGHVFKAMGMSLKGLNSDLAWSLTRAKYPIHAW